jgi:hypothetical protein
MTLKLQKNGLFPPELPPLEFFKNTSYVPPLFAKS